MIRMNVIVEKDLQTRLKKASKRMGFSERELVHRAVETYIDAGHQSLNDLCRELQGWDELEAETMRIHGF